METIVRARRRDRREREEKGHGTGDGGYGSGLIRHGICFKMSGMVAPAPLLTLSAGKGPEEEDRPVF